MMNRAEFGLKLKRHDWFYGYSDDHSVWRRGQAASQKLRAEHEKLDCPFDMGLRRKWAHNMILEHFAEEEPDAWYRQPRKYKCIAPTKRDELITQAKHDEITQWMALGANAHDLARIVGAV